MTFPDLEEKKALFRELENLSRDPGAQDEISHESERRHRQVCRSFFESLSSKPASLPSSSLVTESRPNAPKRVLSAPTPVHKALQAKVIEATPAGSSQKRDVTVKSHLASVNNSFIEETPVPDSSKIAHAVLRRSLTHPRPKSIVPSTLEFEQSPSMGSSIRKRKRGDNVTSKLVPEERRILRGLSLFFIPDNVIAPARKIRIERAKEYGATWTRSLREATHVIVDKKLEYDHIKKTLSHASSSNPIIVNEDFTVDCIRWGKLLNHEQDRYRVRGHPTAPSEATNDIDETDTALESSNYSLQLKEDRGKHSKSRKAPGNDTPEQSQSKLVGAVTKVSREQGHGENPIVLSDNDSSDDEIVHDSILQDEEADCQEGGTSEGREKTDKQLTQRTNFQT
jgi:DNA polymerase IV